jgi:hypothetical protein
MAERRAIDLALDLARMPALAAVMREQALPPDLLDVIRIAAGCPEASKAALAATKEPLRAIHAAAILYLEEILFFPGAGLHRNLGVSAGASKAQMRLHMRWLLQWLHPDHNSDETAALLAACVIKAWRELGRREWPEGGAESSARQQPTCRQPSPNDPRRRATMRVRWIAVPIPSGPTARRRGQRAVILVLVAAAAAALVLIPDAVLFGWLSLPGANVPAASATTAGGEHVTLVDGTRK